MPHADPRSEAPGHHDDFFISHDLTAVEQLCDTAVLLDKGEVMMIGEPAQVISEYHRRIATAATEPATSGFASIAREGSLKITGLTLGGDPSASPELSARTGAPLIVSVRGIATRQLGPVVFEITYYSSDGKTIIATARTDEAGGVSVLPPGGIIEFVSDPFPLKPGACTMWGSWYARQRRATSSTGGTAVRTCTWKQEPRCMGSFTCRTPGA